MGQPNVDIVIDCHDIETLIDFWAAGWIEGSPPENITTSGSPSAATTTAVLVDPDRQGNPGEACLPHGPKERVDRLPSAGSGTNNMLTSSNHSTCVRDAALELRLVHAGRPADNSCPVDASTQRSRTTFRVTPRVAWQSGTSEKRARRADVPESHRRPRAANAAQGMRATGQRSRRLRRNHQPHNTSKLCRWQSPGSRSPSGACAPRLSRQQQQTRCHRGS